MVFWETESESDVLVIHSEDFFLSLVSMIIQIAWNIY